MLNAIATTKIPLEMSKSFTVLFAFITASLSFIVHYIIYLDKAQQRDISLNIQYHIA